MDLGCSDARDIAECDASMAQERGDGLWSEPDEPGRVFSGGAGTERGGFWCIVGAEISEAANDS